MSDVQSPGHRVRFDLTINLGHVLTATAFLISAALAYATLDARVSSLERDTRAQKTDQKESVVNAETRLLTRINDERARLDQTQVRTSDDIREIKQIMRDGFRDLDQKLERKADKPGIR